MDRGLGGLARGCVLAGARDALCLGAALWGVGSEVFLIFPNSK
jgi:hypothetical protein